MTHTTGMRPKVVRELFDMLLMDVEASSASTTECFEAIHELQMVLVKKALAPYEDETCPTCPKPRKKAKS